MAIKLSEQDYFLEAIPQSQPVSASVSEVSKLNSLCNCYLSSSINESVDSSVELFFQIKKVVLGSYHQGNHKYEKTGWFQCTSNVFWQFNFQLWNMFQFESRGIYFFFPRDRWAFIKSSGTFKALPVDELPQSLKIKDCNVEAKKVYVSLFLYQKCLSLNEIGDGAIFSCGGVNFALLWNKNSIFMIDSHICDNKVCHVQKARKFF